MEITNLILLFGAGIVSGAFNAIVGGGSFVSFPALIFLGVAPISANATSTVALWPGTLASLWAQRKDLLVNTKILPVFLSLSFVGGLIGAVTVVNMTNQNFANIVPYMILLASVLFSFKKQLVACLFGLKFNIQNYQTFYWLVVIVIQLAISIYGGFFGAGMGIMFLAFFGILGIHNMHEANAIRNSSAACINSIATIVFIISGKVVWQNMIVMCVGAVIGGYFCAHYARRLTSEFVRKIVLVVAWSMTLYFFWK